MPCAVPTGGLSREFCEPGFVIYLHMFCASFAEDCADLRRLTFSHVELPTGIAKICRRRLRAKAAQKSLKILARGTPSALPTRGPSPPLAHTSGARAGSRAACGSEAAGSRIELEFLDSSFSSLSSY